MSLIDETNFDTGEPYGSNDVRLNNLVPGYSSQSTQLRLQGARLKILTSNNPVLAQNLGLATRIANVPLDDYQLSQQAVALSGTTSMDSWLQTLESMTDTAARSQYLHMSQHQQELLIALGYHVPDAPQPGGLYAAGRFLGDVLHPISSIGSTIGKPILEGVGKIGRLPGQAYLAVRQTEPWIQYIALAAAAAAAAATFIPTGGASGAGFASMIAATEGSTALAAATASLTPWVAGAAAATVAAGVTSTLYGWSHNNPGLWAKQWDRAADGERVFTPSSQHKAEAEIGADVAATEFAHELGYQTPYMLVTEFAGVQDSNTEAVYESSLAAQVGKKYALGSQEYEDAFARGTLLQKDPKFRRAIQILQDGKISFGRDIANDMGLSPGSRIYTIFSGIADATFLLKTDPFLQFGRSAKAYMAWRYGMGSIVDTATLDSRFADRNVQRAMNIMAEAVRTKEPTLVRRSGLSVMWPDLIEYDKLLRAGGERGIETADDIVKWYKTQTGFRDLLRGQAGSFQGHGLFLPHISIPRSVFNGIKNPIGDVINFADDRNVARMVARVLEKDGKGPGPEFSVFKPFEQVAGVLKSIATKIPTNPYINLRSADSLREVYQLTELGRFMGLNTAQRRAMYNMILNGPTEGARLVATRAFYGQMFEGVGALLTQEGRETVSKFMTSFSQKYGITESELRLEGMTMPVGLYEDQLSHLVAIPDIQALRHAVNRTVMSKALGLTDHPWIEAGMARTWKPLTLMRLGFIPRVAGDEVANFIAKRGWKSYINTFGPRWVANTSPVVGPFAVLDRMYSMAFGHLPLVRGTTPWMRHILGGWSDWVRGVLTTAEEGGGLARRWIPGFDNLPKKIQGAIHGSPEDLRYQWMHGNHPMVMQAAREMENRWGPSMARSLSSAHFQALTGNQHAYMMMINAGGQRAETAVLEIADAYKNLVKSDPFFTHFAYSSVSIPGLGPEGNLIINHVTPYASPSVVAAGVNEETLAAWRVTVGEKNAKVVGNILAGASRDHVNREIVRTGLSAGETTRLLKMTNAELAAHFVPAEILAMPVHARAYVGTHLAYYGRKGTVLPFSTDAAQLDQVVVPSLGNHKVRTENTSTPRSARSRVGSKSQLPVINGPGEHNAVLYAPGLSASALETLRDNPDIRAKLLEFLRNGGSGNPKVDAILAQFASEPAKLTQHLFDATNAARMNGVATVGMSHASLNDYDTSEALSKALHRIAGEDRAHVVFYELDPKYRYYAGLKSETLLGDNVRMRSIDPIDTVPRQVVIDRGSVTSHIQRPDLQAHLVVLDDTPNGPNRANPYAGVAPDHIRLFKGTSQDGTWEMPEAPVEQFQGMTPNYNQAATHGDDVYYVDIPREQIDNFNLEDVELDVSWMPPPMTPEEIERLRVVQERESSLQAAQGHDDEQMISGYMAFNQVDRDTAVDTLAERIYEMHGQAAAEAFALQAHERRMAELAEYMRPSARAVDEEELQAFLTAHPELNREHALEQLRRAHEFDPDEDAIAAFMDYNELTREEALRQMRLRHEEAARDQMWNQMDDYRDMQTGRNEEERRRRREEYLDEETDQVHEYDVYPTPTEEQIAAAREEGRRFRADRAAREEVDDVLYEARQEAESGFGEGTYDPGTDLPGDRPPVFGEPETDMGHVTRADEIAGRGQPPPDFTFGPGTAEATGEARRRHLEDRAAREEEARHLEELNRPMPTGEQGYIDEEFEDFMARHSGISEEDAEYILNRQRRLLGGDVAHDPIANNVEVEAYMSEHGMSRESAVNELWEAHVRGLPWRQEYYWGSNAQIRYRLPDGDYAFQDRSGAWINNRTGEAVDLVGPNQAQWDLLDEQSALTRGILRREAQRGLPEQDLRTGLEQRRRDPEAWEAGLRPETLEQQTVRLNDEANVYRDEGTVADRYLRRTPSGASGAGFDDDIHFLTDSDGGIVAHMADGTWAREGRAGEEIGLFFDLHTGEQIEGFYLDLHERANFHALYEGQGRQGEISAYQIEDRIERIARYEDARHDREFLRAREQGMSPSVFDEPFAGFADPTTPTAAELEDYRRFFDVEYRPDEYANAETGPIVSDRYDPETHQWRDGDGNYIERPHDRAERERMAERAVHDQAYRDRLAARERGDLPPLRPPETEVATRNRLYEQDEDAYYRIEEGQSDRDALAGDEVEDNLTGEYGPRSRPDAIRRQIQELRDQEARARSRRTEGHDPGDELGEDIDEYGRRSDGTYDQGYDRAATPEQLADQERMDRIDRDGPRDQEDQDWYDARRDAEDRQDNFYWGDEARSGPTTTGPPVRPERTMSNFDFIHRSQNGEAVLPRNMGYDPRQSYWVPRASPEGPIRAQLAPDFIDDATLGGRYRFRDTGVTGRQDLRALPMTDAQYRAPYADIPPGHLRVFKGDMINTEAQPTYQPGFGFLDPEEPLSMADRTIGTHEFTTSFQRAREDGDVVLVMDIPEDQWGTFFGSDAYVHRTPAERVDDTFAAKVAEQQEKVKAHGEAHGEENAHKAAWDGPVFGARLPRRIGDNYQTEELLFKGRGGKPITQGGINHVDVAHEAAQVQWDDVKERWGVGADYQDGAGSSEYVPDEFLHEAIAPNALDQWDAEDGIPSIRNEDGSVKPRLTPQAVADMTPRMGPTVPGNQMQVFAPGKWADIKTDVFKFFSSVIDAIARRPIAFDRFLNAYVHNMRNLQGLLHPDIWDPETGSLRELSFKPGALTPGQRYVVHETNMGVVTAFDGLPARLQSTGAAWEDVRRNMPAEFYPMINSGKDVSVIRAASQDLAKTKELATQLAEERTVREMMPFIHNPAIRSQFQEYTRNLFPFYFAQNQFMRRWAHTLLTNPEAIRGAQLLLGGLRSIGSVHSDGNGKDMFTIPGSGMLMSIMNNIPGVGKFLPFGDQGLAQFGAVAEASIAGLNPGLSGHEWGGPSAGPLLSVPLDAITNHFPELMPIDTLLTQGYGQNRSILNTIIPTPLQRFWLAFQGDETDQQYAAGMMTVAQMLQAGGHGLPENATDNEIEQYTDRLRNQTRNVIFVQAIIGFIAPSSPRMVVTPGQDKSFGQAIGDVVSDLANPTKITDNLGWNKINTLQGFRSEYGDLVRHLGIEAGHAEFVKQFPDSTLSEDPGIIDPSAFTVAQSHNRGFAPLPATHAALDYYHANKPMLDDVRNAAGWFLPPGRDAEELEEFDLSVYQDQVANKLRTRQEPQDFVRSLKFASAASPYFTAKETYQAELALLVDPNQRLNLTNQYNAWKAGFNERHPIFATELQSAEGAERRQLTIKEMRQLLYQNPQTGEATVPEKSRPWHYESLKNLQNAFDYYEATLGQYNAGRSKMARAAARQLKLDFQDWAESFVNRHPEAAAYWRGVLAPEANLVEN